MNINLWINGLSLQIPGYFNLDRDLINRFEDHKGFQEAVKRSTERGLDYFNHPSIDIALIQLCRTTKLTEIYVLKRLVLIEAMNKIIFLNKDFTRMRTQLLKNNQIKRKQ